MWSTPDLSDVTYVIQGLIDDAVQSSPLANASNITVSCDSPETVRTSAGACYLTLYLLHIGRDPYWRNTPLSGQAPQLNKGQPLSLNLSYLLTAFSEKDHVLEQRAMSIALQAIQSHPIMNQTTAPNAATDPFWNALPNGEFVLSIEADTIEEMSRLWQAFTVPIRLSALIRASVIFIAPAGPTITSSRWPTVANLAVGPFPTTPPQSNLAKPSLSAPIGQVSPHLTPDETAADVPFSLGPMVAVAGGALRIAGNGLTAASDVFLSVPGTATVWTVTTPWRTGVSAGELDLTLPAAYADPSATPPPGATPLPGLYAITVGSGATRSNAIPLVIAPSVAITATPPVLKPDATGLYTFGGGGFIADGTKTKLAIGPTALTYNAGAPGAGEFAVDAGAHPSISFRLPQPFASGTYPILLSVNAVAAGASWVVAS
jgi:hypothetical protein